MRYGLRSNNRGWAVWDRAKKRFVGRTYKEREKALDALYKKIKSFRV